MRRATKYATYTWCVNRGKKCVWNVHIPTMQSNATLRRTATEAIAIRAFRNQRTLFSFNSVYRKILIRTCSCNIRKKKKKKTDWLDYNGIDRIKNRLHILHMYTWKKNHYGSFILLRWSKAIEANRTSDPIKQNVIGDKVARRLYRWILRDRRVPNVRRNWFLAGGQIKFLITTASGNIVCLSNNSLDAIHRIKSFSYNSVSHDTQNSGHHQARILRVSYTHEYNYKISQIFPLFFFFFLLHQTLFNLLRIFSSPYKFSAI